jgi:hypothetical protein
MARLFQYITLALGLALLAGCASTTYVSSNVLQRISQPSSHYYPDYLAYRRGEIGPCTLIDRLPHVALIGDSLSTNMYISSLPSSFVRSKMGHRQNWFLNHGDAAYPIDSIYERLDKITPVVATQYTSPGGFADNGVKFGGPARFIYPLHFSDQADMVLSDRRFPDLLMIWIGLDWAKSATPEELRNPDKHLADIARVFRGNYSRELNRLLDRANSDGHKTAIVVFGVVNFDAFFKARAETEELKRANPNLYPYLKADYNFYPSMRPEYRGNMIQLGKLLDEQLRELVDEINSDPSRVATVRVEYSDALATVDIGHAELIHPMDAWHPSPKGHSVLAAAAFAALGPSLEFLGIESQ